MRSTSWEGIKQIHRMNKIIFVLPVVYVSLNAFKLSIMPLKLVALSSLAQFLPLTQGAKRFEIKGMITNCLRSFVLANRSFHYYISGKQKNVKITLNFAPDC